MNPKEFIEKVKWFSQGALRFDLNGVIVYTDPYRIDTIRSDADYILITHPHHDHVSTEDIEKVIKDETVFIVPMSCSNVTDDYPRHKVVEVMPNDVLQLEDFVLHAVPAYNINKTQYHPRENAWVGYIIEYQGVRFYYTSDTELIPEMYDLDVDIIAVPMGQKFTMDTVIDAVATVEAVKAEIAIPIHYGLFEGTEDDVTEFETMLENKVEVIRI